MAGLFVLLIYGGLLFHQIIDARQQIATLARETARVMAEAPSAEAAVAAGRARAAGVLVGLSLRPQRLTVQVDPGTFAREDGVVSATVHYRVDLLGIPLVGLGEPVISETARYRVQRYGNR